MTQTKIVFRGESLKSLKESVQVKLGDFGIITSERNKCTECDYEFAMRITITYTDGTTSSHCKYCEDKKLVEQMKVATSESQKSLQSVQAKASRFSQMPEDLIEAKLNNYQTITNEQKQAKQMAVDFITNFDREKSFVMSGDPGIGKSHIAVSIAKALLKDYSVLFLKSADVLGLIKESYDNGTHSERDVFDICEKVDLLVLDDIGAEYDKSSNNESWASDILFRILDSRLGKSTIVTTNYSESQLEDKFGMNGKRIVSRMNDKAERIRIFGKDMRKL